MKQAPFHRPIGRTCLVLRLDPDGSATVANAGHLAPYQGSKELPVESAQAEYVESTVRLDPEGELTLVTDGIAEARAKTGELFGFERTASIAILSAQHSSLDLSRKALSSSPSCRFIPALTLADFRGISGRIRSFTFVSIHWRAATGYAIIAK